MNGTENDRKIFKIFFEGNSFLIPKLIISIVRIEIVDAQNKIPSGLIKYEILKSVFAKNKFDVFLLFIYFIENIKPNAPRTENHVSDEIFRVNVP